MTNPKSHVQTLNNLNLSEGEDNTHKLEELVHQAFLPIDKLQTDIQSNAQRILELQHQCKGSLAVLLEEQASQWLSLSNSLDASLEKVEDMQTWSKEVEAKVQKMTRLLESKLL